MEFNIDSLNSQYNKLLPQERIKALFNLVEEDKVLITSSFGNTSAVLLHMLSKAKPGLTAYFVDTGYHFKETLEYKQALATQLGIQLIDVKAASRKHTFTAENKTWQYNQDLCCYINKVQPVDELKQHYSVWVTGLLRYQNENRKNLTIWERRPDVLKFHPILDMSDEEVLLYMQLYELPPHPLQEQGYDSIGCSHCTTKGPGRSGRWQGTAKTECGLHVL